MKIDDYLFNTAMPDEYKELGIFKFAKELFPDIFSSEFALIHYKMCILLFQLLNPNYKYNTERLRYFLVHREGAKSTVALTLFPLYLIYLKGHTIYVKENMLNWDGKTDLIEHISDPKDKTVIPITINEHFIIIASETADQAKQWTETLRSIVIGRGDLSKQFGEKDPQVIDVSDDTNMFQRKKTMNPWRQECFITKDGTIVLSAGIGQHIRGRNIRSKRPSLLLVDDIYSYANTKNQQGRYNVTRWLDGEAINSLSQDNGKVLWTGTFVHPDTIVQEFKDPKESKTHWLGVKAPIISDLELSDILIECSQKGYFDLPSQKWCKEREKNLKTLSWVDKHDLYSILTRYEKHSNDKRLDLFYQEFMHMYKPPGQLAINESSFYQTDVKFYTRDGRQFAEFNHKGINYEGHCNLWMGIDPASSESTGSDDTVITVAGIIRAYPLYSGTDTDSYSEASYEGKLFPIIAHIEGGKYAVRNYERMTGICERVNSITGDYILKSINIETNAQQINIYREIDKELKKNKKRVNIYPEISTGKKGERIMQVLLSLLHEYGVFICQRNPKISLLFHQITTIGTDHDDYPDSLAICLKYASNDLPSSVFLKEQEERNFPSKWKQLVKEFGEDAWQYV